MHFPKWYSPIIQLAVVVTTLLFYWYFSKTIEPAAAFKEEMSEGYFFYILVGELSLLWPALVVAHPARLVKQFYHKRALDSLLGLKHKALSVLAKMTCSQVLIQSLKYSLYILALIIFSGQVTALHLVSFFCLQLLFLPLFLAFGVLSCCIVIYFGRGEKIIQVLISASYVLAGVYFPVKVFPESVQKLFSLSPFNELISQSRGVFSAETITWSFFEKSTYFFLFGLIFYVASIHLFRFIVEKCDRPINHYPLIS